MNIHNLNFLFPTEKVTSKSPLFRPPSFPPPDDWVMTIDKFGNPLTKFGDNYWDFSTFQKGVGFNFGKRKISFDNNLIIKKALFLTLYHPNLFPGKFQSAKYCFYCLIAIAEVCDKHEILITHLSRFPKLHPEVADSIKGAMFKANVNYMHRLRIYGADFDFEILDQKTLSNIVSYQEHWNTIQTPYIPPRIWCYQLNRLNEVLEDFLLHKENLENAFNWLENAYKHNKESGTHPRYNSPFLHHGLHRSLRITIAGGFRAFLKTFNLEILFEKWIGYENLMNVSFFSHFLTMVQSAALLYIFNYSLQRNAEGMSLRSDCFITEQDERLGEIALLVGETTKTDPDSDARWVVPRSLKKAVDIAAWIVSKRIRFLKNPPDYFDASLPLAMRATEPWAVSTSDNSEIRIRSNLRYLGFLKSFPKVFELDAIKVTEEDWKIALSMTPNLGNDPNFGIGLPWPFAVHQLRRTVSVNMFSSAMVSDSSLQTQLKHLSRAMTLYYGRNYSKLRLNSDAETEVIQECYKSIYHKLLEVVTDTDTHVSPHKKSTIPKQIVHLVDSQEELKLTKLISKGVVGCRATLLGYCMTSSHCAYGGIESVSKCVQGDGGGICVDAIFSKKNQPHLEVLQKSHEVELAKLDPGSPRSNALKAEIYAIGVYLNVTAR